MKKKPSEAEITYANTFFAAAYWKNRFVTEFIPKYEHSLIRYRQGFVANNVSYFVMETANWEDFSDVDRYKIITIIVQSAEEAAKEMEKGLVEND